MKLNSFSIQGMWVYWERITDLKGFRNKERKRKSDFSFFSFFYHGATDSRDSFSFGVLCSTFEDLPIY